VKEIRKAEAVMALPVVTIPGGGLPVIERRRMAGEQANGIGLAVTKVAASRVCR
jgi:hypothetical protein